MGALNVGPAEMMANIRAMGNMPAAQQTKEGQDGSFSDLMNSIQTKQQSTDVVTELKGEGEQRQEVKADAKNKPDDKTGKPEEVSKGKEENRDKSTDKTRDDAKKVKDGKAKTEDSKAAKTETGEKLEAAVETIKDTIVEMLDISEEDLEAVMENIGITSLDLLDPQTIPQLVTEVKGTDISAVIADESLTATVQELMGEVRTTVADVAQELNLTPQEFGAAVEAAQADPEQTVEEAAEVPVETQEFKLDTEQANLISDDKTPLREEAVRTPAEAADRERTVVDKPDGQPEGNEIRVEVERADGAGEMRRDEGRQDHRGEQHGTMNLFHQNLANAVNEAVNSNNTSDINPVLTYEEIRDIMNQIQSTVRMRITAETQSMEMQLNPANLGRVGLQIVSRAGAITAQFEATNATVKEALESQVAELRKQLEDQGLKVESVEVTLREKGFEDNFLNDQQQQNMNNGSGRSARTRRILFDPGEDGDGGEVEGVDEAEALTRRMMRLSGNRVDFMA